MMTVRRCWALGAAAALIYLLAAQGCWSTTDGEDRHPLSEALTGSTTVTVASPGATPVATAKSPTATRRPTALSSTAVLAIAPRETPSPTVVTVASGANPSATPTASPTLASLPRLSALVGGGTGGQGRPRPPNIVFDLETELPEAPSRLRVYRRRAPEPLTVQHVREMAGRLGLDGKVYMPRWMALAQSTDEVTRRSYVVIDEPRMLFFEGAELFHYWDRQRMPARAGRWYPPESVPPLEQAIQAATSFLEGAGLLEDRYQIAASGDAIRFLRTIDGRWVLTGPFAVISVWTDGHVGSMQYQHLELIDVGEYPVVSSQEAWEVLCSGEHEGRVWYSWVAGRPSWGEWVHANPKFWARAYRAGQRVDLFGAPAVWYPHEPSGSLHVTMNGLVLVGDLQPLVSAHQALQDSTGDVEVPIHVWGEVQEADEVLELQVEGWGSAMRESWWGTIRRQDNRGQLATDDGTTLHMPDLPSDLPAGSVVFVEGGRWGSDLEWYIIQVRPEDDMQHPPAAPWAGQEDQVTAILERVELVYYVPPLDAIVPELASDPGYDYLQPVWQFAGHMGQDVAFEAWVQAVPEGYLSTHTPDQGPRVEAAARLEDKATTVPVPPLPTMVEMERVPDRCRVEGWQLHVSVKDGYCFAYPAFFRPGEFSAGQPGVFGPPLDESPESLQAKLAIEVKPVPEGSGLTDVVDALIMEFAALPLPAITRVPFELGGEPAQLLEVVPGREGSRDVLAIHDDTLYRLLFMPSTRDFPEAQPDVEALFEAVTASFAFLE